LEKAVKLDPSLSKALANVVYLRNNMCKWGYNGVQYFKDMETIESIVREEIRTNARGQSVVFPHTALAYRVDPKVKLAAAMSYARAEREQASIRGEKETDHSKLFSKYLKESVEYIRNVSTVPRDDLVIDLEGEIEISPPNPICDLLNSRKSLTRCYFQGDGSILEVKKKPGFRIKVAYMSAGITTKALTYLTQNMFYFHDRSLFEVHVYATSKPDPAFFINTIMRGVDYRGKIQDGAEYFHEVHGKARADVIKMIKKQGIHILINWDGYAQNGAKIDGLFGLHPAPIQVSHMVSCYVRHSV
jgi:predicted O-linked N-acetylglucosamine transferase (SPINDLY family)